MKIEIYKIKIPKSIFFVKQNREIKFNLDKELLKPNIFYVSRGICFRRPQIE